MNCSRSCLKNRLKAGKQKDLGSICSGFPFCSVGGGGQVFYQHSPCSSEIPSLVDDLASSSERKHGALRHIRDGEVGGWEF